MHIIEALRFRVILLDYREQVDKESQDQSQPVKRAEHIAELRV